MIDLTRVLGGPYCTQILADHGANVIKVEPPAGDEVRDWGPPFHGDDAAYFVGINRNKRSIGLDLASEGGRAVLMKMLEGADVLIENFKPGTLDKWGIGNEVLRAKFPRLVHCRISGFGADGPRGGNPGYDAIIQAMTGMIMATGSPQSGPMRIGVPVVDITTGLYAAIGILMACRSGSVRARGSFSKPRCSRPGSPSCIRMHANYFMHGKPPSLTGNEHPNLVPYAIFPTRTDNIFIGVGNDGTFRKLCKEIGKPDLGIRSALYPQQGPHRQPRRPARRTCRRLQPARCGTAMRSPAGRWPSRQVRCSRSTRPSPAPMPSIAAMSLRRTGTRAWPRRSAWRAASQALRNVPPKFGQHTAEVLAEFGYSTSEIEALTAEGVICTERRTLSAVSFEKRFWGKVLQARVAGRLNAPRLCPYWLVTGG